LKFLFLVGAEGSGHHLFRSILKPHSAKPWFEFEGKWHPILVEHWDETLRWRSLPNRDIKQKPLKNKLSSIIDQLGREGKTHAYENASFPFNNPRSSIRRPDLIEFDQIMSQHAECRYLVLYRNPVSMTYSAIRRKFTDNPYLQSKIIEDNLIYIASQMQALGADRYKTLCFEDLISQPGAYVDSLAEWWSLDTELLTEGINNIRNPTKINDIPNETYAILSAFFNSQRNRIWEEFYLSNTLR
jgi:hypothetical protein